MLEIYGIFRRNERRQLLRTSARSVVDEQGVPYLTGNWTVWTTEQYIHVGIELAERLVRKLLLMPNATYSARKQGRQLLRTSAARQPTALLQQRHSAANAPRTVGQDLAGGAT
jgi:hypothetical protein